MAAILPAILYVGFLVLGCFQLLAIVAGLQAYGLTAFVAWVVAFLTAYIPLIGTVAGMYGAVAGWGWTWPQAALLFFGPLVAVVGLWLIGMLMIGADAAFGKRRDRS